MTSTSISRILLYRWLVFLLAAGFSVYHIVTGDYSNFGGPFRKLTIWGLLLSFYASSRMIAVMEGRASRSHDLTAMMAATVNCMVVFLYWRLYFEDPALVHDSGKPGAWWDNYYLHLVGPGLQIFDALFLKRAFGRPRRAILPISAVVVIYVSFGEFILQPLSSKPVGSVTRGLAYPFLNNMELTDRLTFYAGNLVVALLFLTILAAVGWLVLKISGGSATR